MSGCARRLAWLFAGLAVAWVSATTAGCRASRASPQGSPNEAGAASVAPSSTPKGAPSAGSGGLADRYATPTIADAAVVETEAGAAPPARTDGCPEGMVRVEGDYCPAVMQDCVEHHPEYLARKNEKTVSERCLKYAEPSRCVSKERVHLSFCVDRYEWPNRVGEMPRVLTSWLEAKAMCEKAGKRLCTEDEHNFACEGPEMLPYATGYVRDPVKCNIDKPYVQPDQSKRMLTYDKCFEDERCAAEMKRLDQRHAIGSTDTCTSWAGVVDINGNVNEWVEIPGEKHPNRSGLKGGWWGPVRSRCRPTVTFHKEFDYGYEAGFRCCKDASSPNATGTARPDAGSPGELPPSER